MAEMTQTIQVQDGREVDVLVGGKPSGRALLVHHGTPSDATAFSDWDETCTARGLQLVGLSRPGYATSSRLAGRSVAAVAPDAATVLDHLGISEFVTVGWSGGGPHALACAGLLSDRCLAAATLAGVGPYGEPDLDFLAGMGPENIEEFSASLAGEVTLRDWMTENGSAFRQVTGAQIAEAFGGLVPQVDQDALTGGYAEHMAAETRRALSAGFDGWVDDDLAFTRPWGFDLGDIAAPVSVWQGDLDLMVPQAHGRWLADHIDTARIRMAPGHGHISLVTQYRDEIVDDLLAAG